MRQLDLADSMGVSVSTIKKIEKGNTKVEFGIVLKAMWFVGVDDIFDGIQIHETIIRTRIRQKKIKPEDF